MLITITCARLCNLVASQCWLYFDRARMIPEVKRLLKPGGRLVTCHISWMPRLDPIARASEELVLKHNPRWTAADWSGHIPLEPKWSAEDFDVTAMFYYDMPMPFTVETWRGRFRACRGVGAALSPEQVEAFDHEHDELLRRVAGDTFTILHRIDAHLFAVKA